MGKRTVKLAYDIDGNQLPYSSGKACLKLRLRVGGASDTVSFEAHGLPRVEYFSRRGFQSVEYLPLHLADRVVADLQAHDAPHVAMVFLPMPEKTARSYAKCAEWVRKGLPSASSGEYLSSAMNW